jgi:hypothetical protein
METVAEGVEAFSGRGQQMPHAASDSRYQNKVAATRVQLPPARTFPLSSLGLFAVRRSLPAISANRIVSNLGKLRHSQCRGLQVSAEIRMTSGLAIGKAPKWRQLVSKLSCSERVRADIQSVASFHVSVASV